MITALALWLAASVLLAITVGRCIRFGTTEQQETNP